MSNRAGIVDKLGRPAGSGGLTMLLVGLCSKLPIEQQQTGILIASFFGPVLTHFFISLIHRFMLPIELALYKKALKHDIGNAKEGLTNLKPGTPQHTQLLKVMSNTQILLATASQDYYSGKLNLTKPHSAPHGQPSAPAK
ncbi:hypothetical protein QN400_10640 [Pseudomonas sp. RTC3]|uniref:hypothetical protein n=1 Tax=Pseudomonas sp. 5C2 TaxID=3048588 RepID=UPI002AB5D6B0|nr:hypothetical protein [Pseudomonas sp. 5C2]MDY7565815.1 hypothetical protein [Pseudomonas sp. 5C2]MEB0062484.1 hypothetical protein [Pseudomonas sp. RTC3]MEB0240489.1 hypothetical protein [Pseudomonas sp. 5C2]